MASSSPGAGRAALAAALAEARRIVVFTGAGVSTESGVPDFRSPGGVWSRMKPITYQDFVADEARRREAFLQRGEIPVCRACGGLVKSATISFGQAMPQEPMARAEAATLECDLFLVLGSSLVVYPAAGFPMLAKRNGARLVIVNREPTDQDPYADLVLHDEIGPAMREAL